MKTTYKRCPRCELNYIKKGEDYCSVCINEMNSRNDSLNCDVDLELCPICKTNYITEDEIMCASCAAEKEAEGEDIDDIDISEWNEYINEDGIELDNEEDENLGPMASIGNIDDGYDAGMTNDLDMDDICDLNFDEIDDMAKDEFSADLEEDEDYEDDFEDDFDNDSDEDDDDDFDDDIDDDDDEDDDDDK